MWRHNICSVLWYNSPIQDWTVCFEMFHSNINWSVKFLVGLWWIGFVKGWLYVCFYRYLCGAIVTCLNHRLQKVVCFSLYSDTFVVPLLYFGAQFAQRCSLLQFMFIYFVVPLLCLDHSLWKYSVCFSVSSDAYYNAAFTANSAKYIVNMLIYFDWLMICRLFNSLINYKSAS